MSTTATPTKAENKNGSTAETQKGIENHKKAATHLEAAAKHHLDAARHHGAGNHDKACESTLKAHGQNCLANETQREIVKSHALANQD